MCQVTRGALVAQEQQVGQDHLDFRVYLALKASLDLLVCVEIPDLGVIQDFQVLRVDSAPGDHQVGFYVFIINVAGVINAVIIKIIISRLGPFRDCAMLRSPYKY